MRHLIENLRRVALVEAKIWGTKGLLDFGWQPFSREVEIGLGGEWWNGELSPQAGKTVTFHHRKENVDDAYKPVSVSWEYANDTVVVTIRGGFLSDPAEVVIGVQKVVSEGADSTPMRCNECGKRFRKRMGPKTAEVECPKCHGYDVEPE